MPHKNITYCIENEDNTHNRKDLKGSISLVCQMRESKHSFPLYFRESVQLESPKKQILDETIQQEMLRNLLKGSSTRVLYPEL